MACILQCQQPGFRAGESRSFSSCSGSSARPSRVRIDELAILGLNLPRSGFVQQGGEFLLHQSHDRRDGGPAGGLQHDHPDQRRETLPCQCKLDDQ
jgi:hypothetical protein